MQHDNAHLAAEATYRQLQELRPTLAVLPWGATEAHNYHLPQGTDNIQAVAFAAEAARLANEKGARVVVLPVIPFGNNAQQLDQIATIHLRTDTAEAILRDVTASLQSQSIRKLVILNSHGGNEFKPLVRDLMHKTGSFIAIVNWWQMCPDFVRGVIEVPGDHADELETSLILHLRPDLVMLKQAGAGSRVPFSIPEISQPGVWTPRPWSRSHPDTGSGDPSLATAAKGKAVFEHISRAIADLLVRIDQTPLNRLP